MKTDGFKELHERLGVLEDRARKLANQNLADIIANAKGKIHQLAGHPDLPLVDDQQNPDGKPGAPNPFQKGSEVGGPDRGKSDTFVPGDPRFDQGNKNPNFQKPNAVDLNSDGTVRQAPNSTGAPQDVRTGGVDR